MAFATKWENLSRCDVSCRNASQWRSFKEAKVAFFHGKGELFATLTTEEFELKFPECLAYRKKETQKAYSEATAHGPESGPAFWPSSFPQTEPRAKNEALARLMDAGKLLFGRLEDKEWQGEWLKIDRCPNFFA